VNAPESDVYALECGDGPLVISAPHVGTLLPDDLAARLTPPGRALVDTDWYADRLYPFAKALGATVLRARWSRYVIDVNRDPAGVSLYPGARTTGLAARRARYFEPYHDALQGEVARLRRKHGYAVLLDAHSIWSPLPLLFEGELPDVNVGTNSGRSCDLDLRDAVAAVLTASPYSHVVDGRFKGGYITRRYGNPAHSVQAIQLEINQKSYLAGGSRTEWDEAKAQRLSAVLRGVCETLLKLAATRSPSSSTIV
jgi:N-formylglutamate amidohydrolase